MSGTASRSAPAPRGPGLGPWGQRGLFQESGSYRVRGDGELQYDGERPGPGWHAHGYFAVTLWMLADGVVRRIRVHKRRWLDTVTGATRHSRPPDDPVGARSSTLVAFLALWGWLVSEHGLHRHEPVVPGLDAAVSRRTVQRWLRRAQRHAIAIQQAVRLAVIQRCEPRPVESLFRGGLPPPPSLMRRAWKDPPGIGSLWRGLAYAVRGSDRLLIPLSTLLAEARGRWDGPADSLVI